MGTWAGVASAGNGRTGYLMGEDGQAWAELEFRHEDEEWSEDAGWRVPVVCRYLSGGDVVSAEFLSTMPALMAAARGADSPWLAAGDPALSMLKPDRESGRVLDGLLSGLFLWDVEMVVRAVPDGTPDFCRHVHPLTGILAADAAAAVEHARSVVASHDGDPDVFDMTAAPSPKGP